MKHEANEAKDSNFVARKWNNVSDNSKVNCDAANEITYNTEVLKSNLYEYKDAYILVRGDITITGRPVTQVAFNNCGPFTKCIKKNDKKTMDDADSLNLVMSMYNLIENSLNYSEKTGSLQFYSKDEVTNFNNNIFNVDNFKYFNYKAKLLENTVADEANRILRNATIAVSLNYVSNFLRSLEIPSINVKVKLKLKWKKYCVFSGAGADNANNVDSNYIIFTIKDIKSYVPVVTFSAKDNQKLSKFLSKVFERLVYWNEYKTKSDNKNMTN